MIRIARVYRTVMPVANTAYEMPVGGWPAPYLLYDVLDRNQPLRRSQCRALMPETMKKIGAARAVANLSTLVVQEGDCSRRNLTTGSVALFNSFAGVMRQQVKSYHLNQESKK
ncbi:MAG: hypothetical protein OEV87_11020 [Phycisphaerae bacterium]|nr:hypothetical protein [Phycisphaerae bacterium]